MRQPSGLARTNGTTEGGLGDGDWREGRRPSHVDLGNEERKQGIEAVIEDRCSGVQADGHCPSTRPCPKTATT